MAVDTRNKRMSLIGDFPWCEVLPNPDGAVGTADRLQFQWLYSGIAADAPVSEESGDHNTWNSDADSGRTWSGADTDRTAASDGAGRRTWGAPVARTRNIR